MPKALIVVDVQNDFCEGGALAVPDGDAVVAPINAMMRAFDTVILTQDWHPEGHSSFASRHDGKSPFDMIDMPYGPQVLWPDHCVQGSQGAEFHEGLNTDRADLIIRKGFNPQIDSYSAFFENDHKTPTGLAGYLSERSIDEAVFVGLALDFCVLYSALDAVKSDIRARLHLPATRAIDMDGSRDAALADLRKAGVEVEG